MVIIVHALKWDIVWVRFQFVACLQAATMCGKVFKIESVVLISKPVGDIQRHKRIVGLATGEARIHVAAQAWCWRPRRCEFLALCHFGLGRHPLVL